MCIYDSICFRLLSSEPIRRPYPAKPPTEILQLLLPQAISISGRYQTLLRWLYAGKVAEPERLTLGGTTLRLWTKADIKRARQYKVKGYDSRRSRKGTGRPKSRK